MSETKRDGRRLAERLSRVLGVLMLTNEQLERELLLLIGPEARSDRLTFLETLQQIKEIVGEGPVLEFHSIGNALIKALAKERMWTGPPFPGEDESVEHKMAAATARASYTADAREAILRSAQKLMFSGGQIIALLLESSQASHSAPPAE